MIALHPAHLNGHPLHGIGGLDLLEEHESAEVVQVYPGDGVMGAGACRKGVGVHVQVRTTKCGLNVTFLDGHA